MRNHIHESSRIAWLLARLGRKRNRILDLMRGLSGFAPAVALKPSLFGKFVRLMDEVAVAKVEEMHILARIETIEHNHLFLRTNNRLRRYVPDKRNSDDMEFEYENGNTDQATRPHHRLLWLILIWNWLICQKNKP